MLLLYLHIAAAILHMVSCVLSIVVHTDSIKTDITIPHHMYQTNPVDTTTTHEVILEQSALVWISGNEAITMFSHLIAVFYLWNNEKMRKYEPVRRTVEYAFTAGILQVALVMGTGSIPLSDIFFVLLVNGVMQLMGYVLDTQKEESMPLLVGAFVLLAAQIQFVITNALLMEGIETGYFVVMGVLYAFFYIGFGLIKVFRPVYQDEIYILMSVTSKLSLSWILIGNMFEGFRELDENTDPDFTDLDWRAIQWAIVAFSAIGLAVGIPLINATKPYKDTEDEFTRKQADLNMLSQRITEFKDLRY
jgi:hypothetical protein